jgi:hypothetical protein
MTIINQILMQKMSFSYRTVVSSLPSLMALASSALLALSGGEAKALIQITSRGALGATDFVDWAQLGPTEPNPFTPTSNLGSVLTVDKALGSYFEAPVQGSNWLGNFAPGDTVLSTSNSDPASNNPIQIFNFPGVGIYAAGTQIQSNYYGAFTARIEAFDALNNSLGFFDVNGVSSGDSDNSAVFIGLRNDVPFAKVALSLVAAPSNAVGEFAINQLDFSDQSTSSVPAPLPVLGAGAAFAFSRKLRSRIRRANEV